MTDADIDYTVTVDALGRITGETFSDISTSTSFMTNSYDYTSYSNRLDERNGIDYGFDTLGRAISEDSTSYTCDILGNPTNAADDGLTYGLDNEERVIQVSDTGGTIANYEYDRLGRRTKKTVDDVDTNFVYDLYGNVIAEYTDGQWSHDYVYGAMGEVVYMQFPRTTEMNDALENFIAFAEAWLCDPNCTQDDLLWDTNDDDQINLIDWAAAVDANDFAGAFTVNGRYLLTDFRNSVIGKVNLDSSVDEIAYTAFGEPVISQGTDLEGLSILWNGYYFDDETGNYYLRNRYYSPQERRFITEDPHGVNPDENWDNPFGVWKQYQDGFGLKVYAQGDPVNNKDAWGLECGVVYYENPEFAGHAGLLVNGNDYDFGPATPNPFYGKGECPWTGGGPNSDAKKTELNVKKTGYLYGNFSKNTAKPIKSCKCATCKDIRACVSELCSAYNNEGYSYPVTTCRSYTRDAKKFCCLGK